MLAQKPWLRVTLFVVVAAVILLTVGALAYNLGAQNAAAFSPRAAQIDRGDFSGPDDQQGQGGRGNQGGPAQDGRGASGGNLPQSFLRTRSLSSSWFSSPLAWLLRAAVGAAFLVMLVLGTVAFFRTGGWRRAPAEEVVEAPKKTTKKSK